jgi:geranylgeranyl pyrophosphate synthase
MGTGRTSEERFTQYIEKTYRKTGSLLAHSCKAVSYNHSVTSANVLCQEILLLLTYSLVECS